MDQNKRMELKEFIRKESKELMMGIKVGKLAFDLDEELAELNGGELFLEVIQEEIGKMRKHGFPEGMPRAMISQPMRCLSDEEIGRNRANAEWDLERKGYHVVDTLFTGDWCNDSALERQGVVQRPLWFLARSLVEMSKCHVVYFCRGWEQARGCRIEHEAAKAYGLEIIYEEEPGCETGSD